MLLNRPRFVVTLRCRTAKRRGLIPKPGAFHAPLPDRGPAALLDHPCGSTGRAKGVPGKARRPCAAAGQHHGRGSRRRPGRSQGLRQIRHAGQAFRGDRQRDGHVGRAPDRPLDAIPGPARAGLLRHPLAREWRVTGADRQRVRLQGQFTGRSAVLSPTEGRFRDGRDRAAFHHLPARSRQEGAVPHCP